MGVPRDITGDLAMTDDRSDIIEKMRERYLREWTHIHGKNDRLKFCEQLAEMAAVAGLAAWKIFADGMSAYTRNDRKGALALFEEAIALDAEFAPP